MKIEQIYTGCLAQGTYYIQSEGEAAIIDPLRETAPYLAKAEKDGVQIKYVFETHFHADFVSGHLSLSEKTGAPIVYGPNANPDFKVHIASDGEVFQIGKITIKALHTPGHTMESTTYLLVDETGKDYAIFTGDTLFLGDVGRPDLSQKGTEVTQEDLAGLLYDSLRQKIMPLADEVIVYPAHGAGSACGKKMMKQTVDTLGNQKQMNYALRANMSKEEFIREITHGLMPPPAYFPLNVKLNKEGYQDIDKILKKALRGLSPNEFETLANEQNALILDVRSPADFAKAHIPNSIFIGLDGNFAPWVGELIIDVQQAILLVCPEGREEEAITRLARVGFDGSLGYLAGGMDAWIKSAKNLEKITTVSADTFAEQYEKVKEHIFDVRKEVEFLASHLLEAKHTPLGSINQHLAHFPTEDSFYLYCAGGYRSMIAASILKTKGFQKLVNINGGYGSLKQTSIPKTREICPSSLD